MSNDSEVLTVGFRKRRYSRRTLECRFVSSEVPSSAQCLALADCSTLNSLSKPFRELPHQSRTPTHPCPKLRC